jgi:hypothetical protein
MFCPFGQDHTRQNKGKWMENVPFRGAANTVWSVLASVAVFLKCDRSKLHAGPKYTDFPFRIFRWKLKKWTLNSGNSIVGETT